MIRAQDPNPRAALRAQGSPFCTLTMLPHEPLRRRWDALLGIEPTKAAEWGYDLNKALSDISNGIWWTAVFPGIAIVLAVLGMTLVGESINEVLNPLLRTRRAAN